MKTDTILFISFLLIVLGAMGIGYYYYIAEINECTSDPIKYGVEQIRYNYDAEMVNGNIFVITKDRTYTWDFGDEIFNIK